MAKGQQKSNRETKKPKKKPEEKISGSSLTAIGGKNTSSSYKDRYAKPATSKG